MLEPWDPAGQQSGAGDVRRWVTGQLRDRLETSSAGGRPLGNGHLQETRLRLRGRGPDLKDPDLTRSTVYTDETSGENYKTF